MPDLNFQDLSTVQNDKQPKPRTIVAATTIAPTTFLSVISGTTALATITAPVTGTHMLAIIAGATESAVTTSGNIISALTTGSTTQPMLLIYNPVTAKYLRAIP